MEAAISAAEGDIDSHPGIRRPFPFNHASDQRIQSDVIGVDSRGIGRSSYTIILKLAGRRAAAESYARFGDSGKAISAGIIAARNKAHEIARLRAAKR